MSICAKETTPIRNYLYNHTSQETAYVVEDYPWGFRLRTTIRYWVESKDAKNGGQRFGSQTINPKTGNWCAPKYSTYYSIIIMYLDEKDYIKWAALHMSDRGETVENFKNTHLSNMNEFQKDKLREILAFEEVMKHVTFTVSAVESSWPQSVSLLSKDPVELAKMDLIIEQQAQRKKEIIETDKQISRAINIEYQKNKDLIK